MDIRLSDTRVVLPGTSTQLFRIRQFEVAAGSKVLVHGRSGVGKTTLLHLIAGLFLPTSGIVRVGEAELTKMTESDRGALRRKYYGMLFQKLNLIDHLTGWENVRIGVFAETDADKRTSKALHKLGMDGFAHQLSGNLSMGEQQRLAVARVVAANPTIALIDEPTSSLDQENADVVMEALFSLPAETTLIMVSHDQRIRPRFSQVYAFEQLVTR